MLEISELHLFEVELPKGINVQTHYFLRTLEIEIPSKNNYLKAAASAADPSRIAGVDICRVVNSRFCSAQAANWFRTRAGSPTVGD